MDHAPSLPRRLAGSVKRRAQHELAAVSAPLRRADLSVFHEFAPPPAGGGNQFLRALVGELERRGLRVERNTVSRTTRALLFNSYNFDFERLRRLARGVRAVHRVDGPIALYRGFDDGTDARIAEINALAEATVFQSQFSLDAHRAEGIELRGPVVIPNAPDRSIFHAEGRRALDRSHVRLIATSWSDNPGKGAGLLAELEARLPPHYELTFVGRTQTPLRRALPPVPSTQLARLLRDHDVYVAASRNDPCSNSLLEALACGLPALYLESGGHPELVGEGGVGFMSVEDALPGLDRLVEEYERRQSAIRVPLLEEVADRYLQVLAL